MKHKTYKAFIVICALLISGCGVKAPSIIADKEEALKTSGSINKFHAIAYYPDDIKLNFPGYIVGIEKSPRSKVLHDDLKLFEKDRSDGVEKVISKLKNDSKLMNITHIFKYDENASTQKVSTKQLYNLYEQDSKNIPHAFVKSWEALKRLKQDIDARDDYDSIIVFSMGWNTSQEEAIRNFNSIYRNLKKVGGKEFNPLFIGITWPSVWESSVLPDLLVKLFSFPNKASDADEVGISWIGALLHHTLKDTTKPLVVIGHSFGARATSMAAFEGNTIYDQEHYPKNKIDCLISLQGAYSLNRFYNNGIEDVLYDHSQTKVVLTASKYDTAMDIGIWAPYVGNESTFEKYCGDEGYQNLVCKDTSAKEFSDALQNTKILYLRADNIIKNNVYNSGGGAHSDIYDEEMGQVLWKIIKNVKEDANMNK